MNHRTSGFSRRVRQPADYGCHFYGILNVCRTKQRHVKSYPNSYAALPRQSKRDLPQFEKNAVPHVETPRAPGRLQRHLSQRPTSGKTTLLKSLCIQEPGAWLSRFSEGFIVCFCGSAHTAQEYAKFIPGKYCHVGLREDIIGQWWKHADSCREKGTQVPPVLMIFDDILVTQSNKKYKVTRTSNNYWLNRLFAPEYFNRDFGSVAFGQSSVSKIIRFLHLLSKQPVLRSGPKISDGAHYAVPHQERSRMDCRPVLSVRDTGVRVLETDQPKVADPDFLV